MAQPVRIEVCGRLAVTVDGGRRDHGLLRQGRLLLAFLALESGRPIGREEVSHAIWSDESSGNQSAALSSLLSRVRRTLGHDLIQSPSRTSLQLAAHVSVDFHEATILLAQACDALESSAPDEAMAAATDAMRIADLGLLPGESAWWLDPRRRELTELAVRARECIVRASLLVGEPALGQAVARAREMVVAEPYHESSRLLLMRALHDQGNLVEALGAYEELRELLRDELGVSPGPALRELHAELLRHPRPGAAGPPDAAPSAQGARSPIAVGAARAAFVGRIAELQSLRDGFAGAIEGAGGQLVLIEGEAGIGKTRLASQFAREREAEGAITLYGRCDTDTLVPYQPFVEALRHGLDTVSRALRDLSPRHSAELTRVLPELTDAEPDRPGSIEPHRSLDRHELFEAVAAVLSAITSDGPALVVLDDLHWADKPTLLMLRQVVRSTSDAPLVLLGTYRETERGEPLLELIADLRREHVVERVALGGLEHEAATSLIRGLSEEQLPSQFCRSMWEESRGNPFFLEEMLRSGEQGREEGSRPTLSVPEAVKDVIGRRLSALSEDALKLLEIGCACGAEFALEILEELGGLSEDALDAALGEAIRARLIIEIPTAYGRFAFEHSLTRQTLYEDLTLTRRARLHLRVGETLERGADRGDRRLSAQLAYHFARAPPDRGGAKAVDYSQQAGHDALELLAWEEAVRHFGDALSALERLPGDPRRRLELLLELGDAQFKSGDTRRARSSFREAADLARELRDHRAIARAALGCGQVLGGVSDRAMASLLQEALTALGDEDDVLRSRLLAQLAIELRFSHEHERVAKLSSEAVALARDTQDPGALSCALIARHWSLWKPENLHERLDTSTELLQLATAAGVRAIELQGHRWRMVNLLELGDTAGADAELDAYDTLAQQRCRPSELLYVHMFRAMRLLMCGRYEEGRLQSTKSYELGQRIGDSNAHQAWTLQMAVLHRDLGGLAEIEDDVRACVRRYPAIPGWRCVLAHLLTERGCASAAAATLAELSEARFGAIPRDGLWLGALAHLAEAACTLGDVRHAGTLYELLSDFPRRTVVIGWAASCLGSSSRPLALLAATLGRRDDALRHFDQALEHNEQMSAAPWAARTRIEYGQFLLSATGSGDRSRGAALVEQGRRSAHELGMTPLRTPVPTGPS